MAFKNSIFSFGGNLAIQSIQSPNFVAGSQGWQVDKLGNAEFNNATIRGFLNLPSDYRARQSDMLSNPSFASTGVFVEWLVGQWGGFPTFQTNSNAALVTLGFSGYNNNSNVSTLRLAVRTYSGPAQNGPWTLENDFNANDAAVVTNTGAGVTAVMQGFFATSFYDAVSSGTPAPRALTSDLVNRPWIQVRPGWRISSGSAATAFIEQARLIVTPGF
jgi:hypothetical protein